MLRERRKSIIWGILVTFGLSLIPSQSSAAIKEGNSCLRKGMTQIYAGKKFTCLLKNKKLIWNAGVVIKKIVPVPTPSATPTAAPMPSTAPSSTPSPSQTTSTDPAPLSKPIAFDNLDPHWTSIVAYKNVSDFAASQAKVNLIKTLHLSPTVTDRAYSKYMTGVDEIAQLWAPLYKNPNFHIILFTEKDSDWIDAKQRELMGSALNNPTEQLQSNRLKEAGCNIGGFYLPNIILFCVKSDEDLKKSSNAEFSALHSYSHEYTHLMGMVSPDVSRFPVSSSQRLMPCWFWEGSATFYGFAFGGSKLSNYEPYRLSFLQELTFPYDMRRNQQVGSIREMLKKNDPALVSSLFKELEGDMGTCREVQNAYALGSMATEVLVAIYGQAGINKLQLEYGQSANWNEAFFKAFGLTPPDFYKKLTPYLASQAAKFPH